MPKPAFPSLACVPSDATISSTSSIGHSGKNDGCRSAPLDALPLPSNRPCALSRKHQSFGPASETSGQKSAKSSLEGPSAHVVDIEVEHALKRLYRCPPSAQSNNLCRTSEPRFIGKS